MNMHSVQALSQKQQSNAMKRKLASLDTSETEHSVNKRINLSNTASSSNPSNVTPLYPNTHSYQISAAARANLGNTWINTSTEELSEDVTMVEDTFTDEEETLNTPSCHSIELSVEDEGDMENGGYIGQLERGWDQLFRDAY